VLRLPIFCTISAAILPAHDTLKTHGQEGKPVTYKEFLKTTLPALGLRWRYFRRKAFRRRIIARLQALGLSSLSAYRSSLLECPEEQRYLLDQLTVTISRFWRNRDLFAALERRWLPLLVHSLPPGEPLRVWSVGCASGEEPYSLLILWHEAFAQSGHELRLLASDAEERCLARAVQACYPASSFKEMPGYLQRQYVVSRDGMSCLPPAFAASVVWKHHNLACDPPVPDNHLILCRNLAYTYFTEGLQNETTRRFYEALNPGGLLVVGRKDRLPPAAADLFQLAEHPVYRRRG
jgi:chemotaxis protein methyltransferase CheR